MGDARIDALAKHLKKNFGAALMDALIDDEWNDEAVAALAAIDEVSASEWVPRSAVVAECEKLRAALRDLLDNCPTFVTAGGVPVPIMVTPAAVEAAERARALVGSAPQPTLESEQK